MIFIIDILGSFRAHSPIAGSAAVIAVAEAEASNIRSIIISRSGGGGGVTCVIHFQTVVHGTTD